MTRFVSMAPVLLVADLDRALAHYRALGFATRPYLRSEFAHTPPAKDRPLYGFADRDGVQVHLCQIADLDPAANTTEVYVYVTDALALHEQWSAMGLPGEFVAPADTEYGLCEGAHIDPDGNSLRYGSWLSGDD